LQTLAQLKTAHDDVLVAVDKLEALTEPDVPVQADLAMARYRLTQAARAKRRLLEEAVYPEIERRGHADRPDVQTLRAGDAALIASSSQHIAAWDIDLIINRWRDYQAASVGVIATIRDRTAQERTILYPLIEDETEG